MLRIKMQNDRINGQSTNGTSHSIGLTQTRTFQTTTNMSRFPMDQGGIGSLVLTTNAFSIVCFGSFGWLGCFGCICGGCRIIVRCCDGRQCSFCRVQGPFLIQLPMIMTGLIGIVGGVNGPRRLQYIGRIIATTRRTAARITDNQTGIGLLGTYHQSWYTIGGGKFRIGSTDNGHLGVEWQGGARRRTQFRGTSHTGTGRPDHLIHHRYGRIDGLQDRTPLSR
mmetsp:Transcript_21095/g.44090  ORF Transcript_21095/g.44090 Transcript_21095/m.44090 type:complete len:223 (-) Transcript_21095:538-1206(-)